jgi:hypothetical protein
MSTIHHHQKKTNSVQDKIVKYVNEIPGIRYRELLRITGISNGMRICLFKELLNFIIN